MIAVDDNNDDKDTLSKAQEISMKQDCNDENEMNHSSSFHIIQNEEHDEKVQSPWGSFVVRRKEPSGTRTRVRDNHWASTREVVKDTANDRFDMMNFVDLNLTPSRSVFSLSKTYGSAVAQTGNRQPQGKESGMPDRRATLPQIAPDFNAGPSTSVTVRTIQRNIIDMGFRSRKPTRVLLLTAGHKDLHLTWARQHRHWTVDWKHVAWSDESRFQLDRADGCVRVWIQSHESVDLTCQQGTVQAGGGSETVWGQDNVTPHTSGITTGRLQYHSSKFRHFRWPPKSPDMNIIEYIWDALQRVVQKISPPPLPPTDLWTASRIHSVNYLQPYFRHYLNQCQVALQLFCVPVKALRDIRQVRSEGGPRVTRTSSIEQNVLRHRSKESENQRMSSLCCRRRTFV
ncbi:transposable element Tcb2 transposase [Trichonephila clavipes]|nr:transposable element Tcb2 transposase [Trichonephila clavipes]